MTDQLTCALCDKGRDHPVHWVAPGAVVIEDGYSLPTHRYTEKMTPKAEEKAP